MINTRSFSFVSQLIAAVSLLGVSCSAAFGSTIVTQWEGLSQRVQQTGIPNPPDPGGAAGPAGVIQTTRTGVSYYTKSGVLIWRFLNAVDFFSSVGATRGFDTRSIYDASSGHFYIVMPENVSSTAGSFLNLAVSKSANPLTGTSADWYFYRIDVTEVVGGNRYKLDYTGLGVDSQALYVTYNMFSWSDGSYLNCQIIILNKTAINGGAVVRTSLFTPGNPAQTDAQNAATSFSLQPVSVLGAGGPGNVAYFAETPYFSTNTVRLWAISDPLDFPTLSSVTIAVPNNGGVPSLDINATTNAPQPGTAVRLQTLSHYTQGFAFWQNGAIWFCQTAGSSSGEHKVYYYKVNGNGFPINTPVLGTSGVIAGGAGEWTYQPCIGGNAVGDVCIVFTQSSSSRFPTIMYTVMPAGAAAFQPPTILKTSPNSYFSTSSTGGARWGDWGTVSADPVDGSFWISHEWAFSTTNNDWSTWFGKISIPSTIPADDAFANRITLSGSAGSTARSNFYASKEGGEPNHAGNSGGRSIWWRWTASTGGILTIDTFGSSFDTLLAVYTGTSVSSLTPVASNDNSGNSSQSFVSFGVVAGTSYQIAVDGANGAQGNVGLHWSFDTDGDGMPDWFETAYGLNSNDPSDASLDSDGDGYTNLEEFRAGTIPKDPASAPGITDITQVGPNMFISFSSVLGKSYLIERNDTFPLNTWTTVTNNVFGKDGATQVTDIGGGSVSRRFYRVQVLP